MGADELMALADWMQAVHHASVEHDVWPISDFSVQVNDGEGYQSVVTVFNNDGNMTVEVE